MAPRFWIVTPGVFPSGAYRLVNTSNLAIEPSSSLRVPMVRQLAAYRTAEAKDGYAVSNVPIGSREREPGRPWGHCRVGVHPNPTLGRGVSSRRLGACVRRWARTGRWVIASNLPPALLPTGTGSLTTGRVRRPMRSPWLLSFLSSAPVAERWPGAAPVQHPSAGSFGHAPRGWRATRWQRTSCCP